METTERFRNGLTLVSLFLLALFGVSQLNELAQPYFAYTKEPRLPKGYRKSAHTAQGVREVNGDYQFAYKFKDQAGELRTWRWAMNKARTDRYVSQFGVPPSIYEPYYATADVIAERNRLIKNGLYKQEGDMVLPDKSRMANYYMAMMNPLYKQFQQTAEELKLSRRDRIQLLMSFVQDVPYGIPPSVLNGRFINGILPPPLAMINKWGDCDTKSILFTSLLGREADQKILFIEVPGHVLLGIEGVPRAYDGYVTYHNRKYIFCEPVGPGRLRFGKGSEYVEGGIRKMELFAKKKINILPTTATKTVSEAPSTGCVAGDCRNGRGVYVFEGGAKYEGYFQEGKFEGRGVYTWSNGSKYVGNWQGNKKEGSGTVFLKSGDKYSGTWREGKKNGTFTYTWANGNSREMVWVMGEKQE